MVKTRIETDGKAGKRYFCPTIEDAGNIAKIAAAERGTQGSKSTFVPLFRWMKLEGDRNGVLARLGTGRGTVSR